MNSEFEKSGVDIFPRLLIEPEALEVLEKINGSLYGQKVRAYIVGGLIRDILSGRDTDDIDIVVNTDAPAVAEHVADSLGGKYVLIDKVNRVARVILPAGNRSGAQKQWILDFTSFSGEIEHDLARRDFTIDAMAVDLEQLMDTSHDAQLIDPYHGSNDLDHQVIRTVSDDALESDAVRVLRAVRLSVECGFIIDRKTEADIQRCAYLIKDVAGERVREELLRLLAASHGGQIITYLDKLGILTAIIPELAEEKGVMQPKEHYWDVFEHSVKTVSAIDYLLRQGVWEYIDKRILETVPWSAKLAEHFEKEVSSGSTRRTMIKLAALLHDIAKPATKSVEENGKMRFLGHGVEGAAVVVDILTRLRFSAKEIKLVETLVKHHLRPTQMSQEGLPTSRAIYRFFRDTGEAGIDIQMFSLADHLATRGPELINFNWKQHTTIVNHVISRYYEEEQTVPRIKLIDGHDLIDLFGMKPGAELGRLLELAREAQAAGELNTRREALDYIRNCLTTGVK